MLEVAILIDGIGMFETRIFEEGKKFAGKRSDRRDLSCVHKSFRGTSSETIIVASAKTNASNGNYRHH